MRRLSRKNKQKLTHQFKVEHIATKLFNDFLARKGQSKENSLH